MPEDEFKDSKSHLTMHLTGKTYNLITERTRINSAQELRWVHWKKVLARHLWPGFNINVDAYLETKISKDGESRLEDKEVLQSQYRDERIPYSGFPMADIEEFRERKDEIRAREKNALR